MPYAIDHLEPRPSRRHTWASLFQSAIERSPLPPNLCRVARLLDVRFLFVRASGQDGIQCTTCGQVSWNPNDVEHHYCGRCHVFHDDQLAGAPVGVRR